MEKNLRVSVETVLGSEGGYVNDSHDPGGETKYGISKRAYPSVDIKNLTKEDAIRIYKRAYWDKVKGDSLPSGIDIVVFDGAINSGVSRSAKWLQKAVGVPQDGLIGPQTIYATQQLDCEVVIRSILAQRYTFLRSLPTWSRYKNGWTRRLEELKKIALSLKDD